MPSIRHWLRRIFKPHSPSSLPLPTRQQNVIVGSGKISSPSPPILDVPVRIDGAGMVALAHGIRLGYAPAPRIGDGEILLQARTPESTVSIGQKTILNNNVSIVANIKIQIGDRCLIGNLVMIFDSDFHHLDPARRLEEPPPSKPVIIGNNVWIGSSAIILKGVHIGDNSVVGAGAVVTRDVPANVVVAGNPAKIIRQL